MAGEALVTDLPIGVFDSGVGGLTVVSALQQALPEESILYLGDTARLPYGTKSKDTVTRYSQGNVDFLVRRGVKAVVVACNTAASNALEDLECPVPLFGVVRPGARRACAVAKKRVGVIATESTIRAAAYQRRIQEIRPELKVLSQPCPLFVPLVEEGWIDDPVTRQVAERYLEPLIENSVDTLVLGCTHYPLLRSLLQGVLGEGVSLVDSAEAISQRVAEAISVRVAPLPDQDRDEYRAHTTLCFTDGSERFKRLATQILLPAGKAPPDGQSTIQFEWVDISS